MNPLSVQTMKVTVVPRFPLTVWVPSPLKLADPVSVTPSDHGRVNAPV
jgi:hypothetical protein